MKFARLVFLIAGIYGLVVTAPLFLAEGIINSATPPAITHPEYYYGFACVTFVFQLLFFLIAGETQRYRPIMLIAALEKTTGIAFILLVLLHLSPPSMLIGVVDVLLGLLFLVAYNRTDPKKVLQKALSYT